LERLAQPDLLGAVRKWQNACSLVLHIERRLKSTGDIAPGSDINSIEWDTITTLVRQRLGLLARRVPPRDVKLAIDYIHANLRSPITLLDIVDSAGVPERTLLHHFKAYRSVSPMVYVRRARFSKVRDALLSATPESTIAALAMDWGFNHLGRFSTEYRARFGETPSRTLRRHRA
jgi:transcriptional regulator GlxA family with amidase domain